MSKTQMINMRYPKGLLERIDRHKEQKGFTTRTQAIIHLLQVALDKEGI